jgi:hypothetical protein
MRKITRTISIMVQAYHIVRYLERNRSTIMATISDTWVQMERINTGMFRSWRKLYSESGIQKLVAIIMKDKAA